MGRFCTYSHSRVSFPRLHQSTKFYRRNQEISDPNSNRPTFRYWESQYFLYHEIENAISCGPAEYSILQLIPNVTKLFCVSVLSVWRHGGNCRNRGNSFFAPIFNPNQSSVTFLVNPNFFKIICYLKQHGTGKLEIHYPFTFYRIV